MDRDAIHLLDVLDIGAYDPVMNVVDASRQEFLRDTQLQDSVIRRLEIIAQLEPLVCRRGALALAKASLSHARPVPVHEPAAWPPKDLGLRRRRV